MEKLAHNDKEFLELSIIKGLKNLETFKKALSKKNTKYFWDIDGILANTPDIIYKIFNRNNKYGQTANIWETCVFNYLTYLVEKAGFAEHKNVEENWYRTLPLYMARRYEYSRLAMREAMAISGKNNNYVLTSRIPQLYLSTDLWLKREFPEFDRNKILMRRKNDLRGSSEFKTESLEEHSGKDHYVVLIEDQERYIKSALESESIENLLVIGVPPGMVQHRDISDDRYISLARYPVKKQETYPLYCLIRSARSEPV